MVPVTSDMMADDQDQSSPFLPENEEQFWNRIGNLLADAQYDSLEAIDNVLRSWLAMVAGLHRYAPEREEDIGACVHRLLTSPLFGKHRGSSDNDDDSSAARRAYVRTQMIHSLLQEDDLAQLHAIACFLLLDGRGADEDTFPRMVSASCFPRLLELIGGNSGGGNRCRERDPGLHRLLLQLMYEMAGMERLRIEDLLQVDDGFIQHLFGIIEGLSDDVHDPYHYPTIRVLLVLNEQYMLASTALAASSSPSLLTNRVIKCLSLHGPSFRTFGENIILLLNRETETSLQLLILKLFYLLFTTKSTYEYFYTNDLKVLLDVIIRNLMDLPDERISLRHTYLRVLYPLLSHTQLNQPPHYKRDEIARVLGILRGSGNAHFAPADETTLRLVDRVSTVEWLLMEHSSDNVLGLGDIRGPDVLQDEQASGVAETMTITPTTTEKVRPAIPLPRRHRVMHAASETKPLPAGTPQLDGQIKIPPKAPPPRRWGRLKAAVPNPTTDDTGQAS